MTITAKEAADHAAKYLKDFIPQSKAYLVEEVERDVKKDAWLITLSYDASLVPDGTPWLTTASPMRGYKIFEIDAETGEVNSMKIRDLN